MKAKRETLYAKKTKALGVSSLFGENELTLRQEARERRNMM